MKTVSFAVVTAVDGDQRNSCSLCSAISTALKAAGSTRVGPASSLGVNILVIDHHEIRRGCCNIANQTWTTYRGRKILLFPWSVGIGCTGGLDFHDCVRGSISDF